MRHNAHRTKSSASVTDTVNTTNTTISSNSVVSVAVTGSENVYSRANDNRNAAIGVRFSTSKGAIPKTKAANKQYELPSAPTQSWYDQTEESQRDTQAHRSKFMDPFQPLALSSHSRSETPYEYDRRVGFTTNAQLKPVTNEPPRLVRDTNVNTVRGDSAYFHGGEYRKPDARTIFIEGLDRMYQNTFQDTFALLGREPIEYHIRTAEKYWDKYLDAHNQLYNQCTTAEEIEAHRVVHRNTQRLNEQLVVKLLQQLSRISAEEREEHRRLANPVGHDQNGQRNIMHEGKFERIKIPPFDGQPQKWPQFKRLFETYFHNTGASNSAKMVHLLNHLAGEVLSLISGLDPRGEN